jgi:predicted O-linked N-acetylglucosamine transferase (SPINDLY family)
LFLDTLPYNACGTAYDALWAGLPVLSCAGSTFAGRVAGAMLSAAGLDALVTTSLQDYEMTALQLAQQPVRLAALRRMLVDRRASLPLFDADACARDIEGAFLRMWEIWRTPSRQR